MGSSGSVSSPVIGTQVVQGAIGLNVGYTCPVGAMAAIGLLMAFKGPSLTSMGQRTDSIQRGYQFMERFGFGAPVTLLVSLMS